MAQSSDKNNTSDVAIVGGGLSALLLAARLVQALPTASITVLEKETQLGGRISGNVPHLQRLSRALVDFFAQTLTAGECGSLPRLCALQPLAPISLVVGARQVSSVARHELFSAATVQQLGNRALAATWERLTELSQSDRLKKMVKSFDLPLATLLDKLAVLLDVPAISTLTVAQLQQKLTSWQEQELLVADWQAAVAVLAQVPRVSFSTDCRVVATQREEDGWLLHSARGTHRSRVLVVAQPPWTTNEWLAAEHLPPSLVRALRKSRPHSVVALVTNVVDDVELPQELCVPAEGVQVLRQSNGELVLARVLSYETQLRAPAVTAAVGKLKRALRTVNRVYAMSAETRLIALVPAAYCLPLGEVPPMATGLFFCGDSYGNSIDGDGNIITSVQSVYNGIVQLFAALDR